MGLWLNVPRAELRRATGVLKAISAATSNNVGPEFFTANADDDEEATAMYQRYQADQAATE